MKQHREVFESVRARSSMYLPAETYAAAAAFVLGYDMACEGGVLSGFREWLILRLGRGFNLTWSALVLQVAFPNSATLHESMSSPAEERVAIETLFDLIAEFDAVVGERRDGVAEIYAAFVKVRP